MQVDDANSNIFRLPPNKLLSKNHVHYLKKKIKIKISGKKEHLVNQF